MLNKCPVCSAENALFVEVDAHSELEGDHLIKFKLDPFLKVLDTSLPQGVYTYDKDRIVACENCGASDDSNTKLFDLRKEIRSRNPDFI